VGKVISIINMKGGVGKTTLCVGISDYLAEIGKKILLIGADPQFNATQSLLDQYKATDNSFYTSQVINKEKTIFRLFSTTESLTKAYEYPTVDELKVALTDNLDLICGDLRLVLSNNSSNARFAKRIKTFIDKGNLKDEYDYIFIEKQPSAWKDAKDSK